MRIWHAPVRASAVAQFPFSQLSPHALLAQHVSRSISIDLGEFCAEEKKLGGIEDPVAVLLASLRPHMPSRLRHCPSTDQAEICRLRKGSPSKRPRPYVASSNLRVRQISEYHREERHDDGQIEYIENCQSQIMATRNDALKIVVQASEQIFHC
jgi:hypothetical protein